ncbi:MAG: Holliday junction resolvase RuvX [Erysipelotrichaceae bacterium]|nr:Holliday junction resolvase RuvX [Erysipelotrichaceae bacterium]
MNKILGLDLGSKTCGVAASDIMGIIASPVKTIRFEADDYETACAEVCALIDEYKAGKVVLGLPKHMNGDVGIRGEISLKFKDMIQENRDVEVILWDERLTTVSAQRSMIASNMNRKKRKQMVDTMAAVIILQSYLDSVS